MFAVAYARFRGSAAFPALLILAIASWMAWSISVAHGWLPLNGVVDTPGEWGSLNVALSMEASISTSLLLMDMARSEVLLRRQLTRMEKQNEVLVHMVESQLAILARLGDSDVEAVGATGPAPNTGLGRPDDAGD
ncbi:MAG: hypothetical protein ACREDC_00135 [Bradyrhizobium sp.]